jgi:hypothetical protein
VSEHPAPVVRAGPLEVVLRGLLTKDPAQRSTAAQARQQLQAVLAGHVPAPPPPHPATAPPPPPRHPVPGGRVERIDGEDLRRLASASKALLGSMARDAAGHLADRRRERRPVSPPSAPARRWRFRRRWVVVPLVVTVLLVVLVVGGAVLGLAWVLGLL